MTPPIDGATSDSPPGTQGKTPIRHVVVLVKENRTFDNYFTGFPGAETTTTAKLSDGTTITRPKAPDTDLPCDPRHDHASALRAYNDGAMDAFDTLVTGACPKTTPFVAYAEAQIPNYWQYARNFVLADHFFSTMMGPTSPGHFATVTGQTPFYGNTPSSAGCAAPSGETVQAYNRFTCNIRDAEPCFDVASIVDELPEGMTWRAYGPKVAGAGIIGTPFNLVKSVGGNAKIREEHYRGLDKLVADLEAGDQPNFVQADIYSPNELSEHPPARPCEGENYTVEIVNRIMQGPHWKDTVILITYDDFGGFFDHVAPTIQGCGVGGDFYNTGFRLPMTIISPFAKKGFVLKTKTEHASIPKLVEDLFGMRRLVERDQHARDGFAGSLLDALDFAQAPREPLILKTRDCGPK